MMKCFSLKLEEKHSYLEGQSRVEYLEQKLTQAIKERNVIKFLSDKLNIYAKNIQQMNGKSDNSNKNTTLLYNNDIKKEIMKRSKVKSYITIIYLLYTMNYENQ